MHLLPPLDYWYTYFFLLAGPGPLHDTAVSAYSRSCTYGFIAISSLNPPYISMCCSSFTLFLSANLSLISILLCSSVLCAPQTSPWTLTLLGFLLYTYILPHFLAYAIPSYSSPLFPCFLPCSPISHGWQPFIGVLLTSDCHFHFLASRFELSGYIPSSDLSTVLLVVLEHPSTSLAAVICTVSSCFNNFAFPTHTSPAS